MRPSPIFIPVRALLRRFFFHNAYLEFLWVQNEQEVQSQQVRPLCLWERWQYRQTRSSPFGLGLHSESVMTDEVELPFKAWAYRPPWLPHPLLIKVAENATSAAEPLLFYASFFARPDVYPVESRQPLEHSVGFAEITGLRITMPSVETPSESLVGVDRAGIAAFVCGESHVAEVIFDGEGKGQAHDFRPSLPLIFRW